MTYPGGKNGSGVYQQIINVMPPHSVYIEPFLGGGAVMRMKRPATMNIGIDLDPAVIRMFRPIASKMAMVLEARDGIIALRNWRWHGGELVYCDPPYMQEACASRCRYKYALTYARHRELLAVIRRLPCHVIISGYWTPLYERMLKGWHTITFQTTNRAAKRTTEYLWMNFAPPVELHDYRYLGANWRERERIKKKKARWVARLGRMPALERRALLAAIAETRGKECE